MLRFVLEKIRNKKWLIASLLIGNLLLVAVSAASPMYTKAALQRMLTRTMSDYTEQHNRYPTAISVFSGRLSGHEMRDVDGAMMDSMAQTLGVDPIMEVRGRYIVNVSLYPELARIENKPLATAVLGTLEDLEEHVEIVSGSLYEKLPGEDGVVDAIVSEKAMVDLSVMQGEILSAPDVPAVDGSPLRVRIAGVFRAREDDGQYWYRSPSSYKKQIFISGEAFDTVVSQEVKDAEERRMWYWIFDYKDLTVDNCAYVAETSSALKERFSDGLHHTYTDAFSDLVAQYLGEAAKVRATLRILQVPIYVLLAAFIFMVSRQMLEMEAAEIAVLKSRGASRPQIIGIYALQSALLAGVSLVLGIPLAMGVCQIIGSANAFLEFVSRSMLRVQITLPVLLYALAASVLSMAAMVLPVLQYSRTTIVAAKQKKARKHSMPLWQRLFADVILIGVSLYGLYSFHGQEAQITEKVQNGAGLDPLIYLSSSLFIVGCGLLALRIIPLLVRLVYKLGEKRWSPSLYASYLWVMRSKGGGYIITFLVVTIALGIFNASIARTVNSNEIERVTYLDGGMDMVLVEKWWNNSAQVADDTTGMTELYYQEPDYGRFLSIPGLESATRVYCDTGASAVLPNARKTDTLTLMGIQTKEFGETASLKGGLLPSHFYDYLNAISQRSNAVLVSTHFRDDYGFKLGDVITFRNNRGDSARGVIYGFVDYWPSYKAAVKVRNADGTTRESANLLVVANLGYLQAQWGVAPYQVWLKMEDGDTAPVYDFVREQKIPLLSFRDQTADLVDVKNDPGIQGTNGILTVGFVVALVLCTVGFLIYWIFTIRGRALQFGVFRAMGMGMKEILQMLLNEQLCVSGLSILFGVGTGILASRLFVPLIQLAYARMETPLPLEVSLAGGDVVRLLIVVLLVMAVCMAILGAIIRKLKIDQALKLGED